MKRKFAAVFLIFFLCLSPQVAPGADMPLADLLRSYLHISLAPVGKGTYRKFGFRVYEATLWAAGGKWNPRKPYALELHYTRDVSQETLADTVIDDIRDQNVADEATCDRWESTLRGILPAVTDGDTMAGVAIPGKKSHLFLNGTEIASIDDPGLSQAFFNIWLGDHADEDLRHKLLGEGNPPPQESED